MRLTTYLSYLPFVSIMLLSVIGAHRVAAQPARLPCPSDHYSLFDPTTREAICAPMHSTATSTAHVAIGRMAHAHVVASSTQTVAIGSRGMRIGSRMVFFNGGSETQEAQPTESKPSIALVVWSLMGLSWLFHIVITYLNWHVRRKKKYARWVLLSVCFGWAGITSIMFLPWRKIVQTGIEHAKAIVRDAELVSGPPEASAGQVSVAPKTGGEVSFRESK